MRPFDWFDLLTVGGLGMVFVGLWWLMPAAALIVVGVVVFLAGVCGEAGNRRAR